MNEFDSVRTLVDVKTIDDVVVPAGTVGAVTDVHGGGKGLAVDVLIDGEPNQIYVTIEQVEQVEESPGTRDR